jgi:hypothetical protein
MNSQSNRSLSLCGMIVLSICETLPKFPPFAPSGEACYPDLYACCDYATN